MNPIRIIVVGVVLFSTIAYGAVRGSLPEFADVKFERGILIITTDDSQGQFVGKIGKNGVAAVLHANSDIEVPLNENSLFYLRHLSLNFTPLSGGKGFIIKRTTDLRSLRRGLKEVKRTLKFSQGGAELSYDGGDLALVPDPPGLRPVGVSERSYLVRGLLLLD